MKMGDDMMVNKTRILKVVVAAAACLLLGVAPWVAAAEGLPHIDGMRALAGPQGPVIHVALTGNVDTVQYSPQPGVWVVEMPDANWAPAAASLHAPDLGIERAEISRVDEFGRRITRLTVWLKDPATLKVDAVADGFDLHFGKVTPSPAKAVDAEDLPVKAADSDGAKAPEPQAKVTAELQSQKTPPRPRPAVAPAEPVAPAPSAAPAPAQSLLSVAPVVTSGGLVLHLRGDGPFQARVFALPNPNRVVVDLPGIINRVKRHFFSIGAAGISRVRIAQFRVIPTPVTRVVVDLQGKQSYTFTPQDHGGDLIIGNAGASPKGAVQAAVVSGASPSSQDGTIEIERANGGEVSAPLAGGNPALHQVVATNAPSTAGDSTSTAPEKQAQAQSIPAPLPPVRAASDTPAAPAAKQKQSGENPWVANPSQLLEQASAQEVLGTRGRASAYATKEVSSQERQFTGEPISMRLKDADIKDVLRTFAELTNLNIVVDPGVSGSVTVDLHNVPWDQALDLVLKINGLGYVLENNVLRVAPLAKLAAEKREKANLAKERENAEPLKTVLKPLSYSKASYIKSLLTKDSELLSSRGSVVVDQRTNTLIIRDVVDRVEGVLRLIDSLDQPTPQVVIEGRIVETTRDFSHELGVNWGFTGVMDAAHGNDTGLKFPNSVHVGGGVNLGSKEPVSAGNFPLETGGVVAMTFGDILNTFNLDFTLRAAEVEGLVKIVSSPRVTTQNNEPAMVQSGLQIPVQTVANNTVTVQYIDATLKLQVTPQITADGTVLLDIKIRKREPATGVNIQGGTNAPIFTRDAQTKLLVRDGGTTVIAGIYQINDQVNENRVPGLSKIPILGALFRNRKVFNRHDELLIFITPRIVKY
ncbi:MAG: type IV pilus secretin PilQ [Acidobacteria bacterium]|nr:type IV pilus secretin PilQ [Acidobacteriota bacterium]